MSTIDIGGRLVGAGRPCFVIAEAGVNHNGDLALARRLVDVAAAAEADAVKFQTFRAERLALPDAPKAAYQLAHTDGGESAYAMLSRLELSPAAHRDLAAYCRERGILFLSTPFDEASADLLFELGVPAFKIGSGELTNLPLLGHVARMRRPIIASTGMAWLGEVETAVRTMEAAGNTDVALLHCVSNYPAEPADVNLRAMDTLALAFGRPVGYSDHTLGIAIALAAVARGACIVEKHVTLDRGLPGPDQQASIEPDELVALVQSIRAIEAALGDGRKRPAASEANTAASARRSVVAARAIRAGELLCEDMLTTRRPGTGLAPALLPYLLGRRVREDLPAGALLSFEALA